MQEPGQKRGPGRPRKPEPRSMAERVDGWNSALTAVGRISHDKRQSTRFDVDVVSYEQARDLWRGDDIAARAIEVVPNEMLREGFDLQIAADANAKNTDPERLKDAVEQVESQHDDLQTVEKFRQAQCFRRAYGGGAVLLGVDDGQTPDQPLVIERARSLTFLSEFEPEELTPMYYYANPLAPKYGQIALYQFNPITPGPSQDRESFLAPNLFVHESRLVVFNGVKVSRRPQPGLYAGWGDSVLTRMWRVLRDFNMSWDAAGILVHDFAQAIYKLKGLADLISQDNAAADQTVAMRIKAVELSRSVARAVIIDAEESFERQQTPLSGLPELLDRFSTRLAAAVDMPLTLLMGQSPGGLNATGESDIRFFYDRIASAQTRELAPALDKVNAILLKLALGSQPKRWAVEFRPLWQETTKEIADARYVQAQTDALNIQNQVVTPEEIAVSRFGGDRYSFETRVDFEGKDAAARQAEREAVEAAEAAAKAEAMKASMQAKQPGGEQVEPDPGLEADQEKPVDDDEEKPVDDDEEKPVDDDEEKPVDDEEKPE